MNIRHISAAVLVVVAGVGLAQTVSAQERLPWGAIKGANKDGTIPAWDGGLPANTAPAGFKKDSGFWADPYAADKVLFSITAKNMDQYADKLSEGMKAMLKQYPTLRMDVYPTRRPANYDQWVIDNTNKNAAGRCKTVENGEGLVGCFGGIPFPVPKNGYEAMWNLQLAPKGVSSWSYSQGWFVDANGNKVFTTETNNRNYNAYYDKNLSLEQFYAAGGVIIANNNVNTAPARVVGEGSLQRITLNPIATPNKSWNYTPGQRRTRLAPDLAYDFPVATSAGAMMYDEIYGFNGRMDRFNWKYEGVKEIYMPINNYKLMQSKPEDILRKNHHNPDLLRWELHRVHVVEATLKAGSRHTVPKKRFYIEEDQPSALLYDGYDASGKLSRAVINPVHWAYDKQVTPSTGTMYFDLATGAWYFSSMGAAYKGVFIDIDKVDTESFYSPDGLARRAVR